MCHCILMFSLGERLMIIFKHLTQDHQKEMHCQFSKSPGSCYLYMIKVIKWYVYACNFLIYSKVNLI